MSSSAAHLTRCDPLPCCDPAWCRASWRPSWRLSWPATASTLPRKASPLTSFQRPWRSWRGAGQVGCWGRLGGLNVFGAAGAIGRCMRVLKQAARRLRQGAALAERACHLAAPCRHPGGHDGGRPPAPGLHARDGGVARAAGAPQQCGATRGLCSSSLFAATADPNAGPLTLALTQRHPLPADGRAC